MKNFLKNNEGATAIEYGLIIAVLVIAIVAGMLALGNSLGQSYNNTAQKASAVMP